MKIRFISSLHSLKHSIKRHKISAFTLVELLIVIGILSILATLVVFLINPIQLFHQSRDSRRLSDIKAVNDTLNYYQSSGRILTGDPHKVYLSLPANNPDCSDRPDYAELPPLPTGYTYSCQTQANYRNTDGTGWIPVNLNLVRTYNGPMLSSLPVDPTNTTCSSFYYIYIPVNPWYLSATMQSDKYKDTAKNDGGVSDNRYEIGPGVIGDPNQVVAKIKQSCAGETGLCYTSLAQWQADFGGIDFGCCDKGDLVCANKSAVAQIDGTWTLPDTSPVTIEGWNTSPADYIKIYTTTSADSATPARHNGVYNTNKYRMELDASALFIGVDNIVVDGLQIKVTSASASWGQGIVDRVPHSSLANVTINNNIIRGVLSGTADLNMGISDSSNFGGMWNIYNNIIYGFKNGSYNQNIGIDTRMSGIWNVYNNTLYGNYIGVSANYWSTNIGKNNISYNNIYDYQGTFDVSSNNLSKDATSPDSAYRDKILNFVNTASGSENLHLSSSDISAINQGVIVSGFNTDIDGDTRDAVWDIGADEFK